MRIALFSDLHNECQLAFEPQEVVYAADVVVLAGDIARHTHGLDWAASRFPRQPVVYVAGNHEYDDAHLGLRNALIAPIWPAKGVHFLDRQSVEFPGVRFLGCTLWSDFALYGQEHQSVFMEIAEKNIPDYFTIRASGGKRLTPRDTLHLHRSAVAWLAEALSQPFDGKTVVVTHFAPHLDCVSPQHQHSSLSPYFVSDLTRLMAAHRIDLWCHGHTHHNTDFIAENGCRVVSNQRGYPGTKEHGFNPGLVLEL